MDVGTSGKDSRVPEETERHDIETMYADGPLSAEEIEAVLDASLDPRGPDLLFERAGELGVATGTRLLDVGCRDGRQLVELRARFGCRGVGIDPLAANLARAPALAREIGAGPPIALVQGRAEALPFPDASFDFVWVRDVLVHVAPLTEAFAECRRVLRPGAPALVFQQFATPWLDPAEAERLWAPLAVVGSNTDRSRFEQAITEAGLRVDDRDELRSEWREHLEEHDRGRTSRQLLHAARLLRAPDRYRAALGNADYAIELADSLWGVYQMIGKLSPAIYVLRAAR
jgi:ubiquinone/menaquinone biosynthesis C-methylase UbiE